MEFLCILCVNFGLVRNTFCPSRWQQFGYTYRLFPRRGKRQKLEGWWRKMAKSSKKVLYHQLTLTESLSGRSQLNSQETKELIAKCNHLWLLTGNVTLCLTVTGVSPSAASRWRQDDTSTFLLHDIAFVCFCCVQPCAWSGLSRGSVRQVKGRQTGRPDTWITWAVQKRGEIQVGGETWHSMVWLLCVKPGRKALKAST